MPPPNSDDRLDDLDLDDLYAQLAIAEAGTDPDLGEAGDSLREIRMMLTAEKFASTESLHGLIGRGKRIFNKYWPKIREAVCKAWNEHGEDWLDKAAEIIAGILPFLPKFAVRIILKIAVKLGMDAICDTNASPQPA